MPEATASIPAGKAIVFKFIRGPRDGQESLWDSILQPTEALAYWAISDGGKVGKLFACMPIENENAIRRMDVSATNTAREEFDATADTLRVDIYRVVNRQETNTEITVTCEYCGAHIGVPTSD